MNVLKQEGVFSSECLPLVSLGERNVKCTTPNSYTMLGLPSSWLWSWLFSFSKHLIGAASDFLPKLFAASPQTEVESKAAHRRQKRVGFLRFGFVNTEHVLIVHLHRISFLKP